jgi:quercetin dioxygenase-like cupin family protein
MRELAAFEPVAGVRMKPLFGDAAMLNWIELTPGAEVPLHEHPHEQLGLVVRGAITMTTDGEDWTIREGDGYTIPGGVPHKGVAGPDGCVVLDVFTPVREDYREALARPAP